MTDKPITLRLKRVEGQIRGLQRMLEAEANCEQVLTQLLAARSALDQIGLLIMSESVDDCLVSGSRDEIKNNVRRLFNLILSRYSAALQSEDLHPLSGNESYDDIEK